MAVDFESNEIDVVTIAIPGGVDPEVISIVEPSPGVVTIGVPGFQGPPGEPGEPGPAGPPGGITDHGALSGLSDNDHPQYSLTSHTHSVPSHTHDIDDINATGTKDDTTYLRGDGTWSVPAGGGGGGVSDHGSLTGLADDDHPQYHNNARGDARYALTTHDHVAADISNSTTVGRAVLTAVDAAAGRTAIGAGTSSLVLGTLGTEAAAGNHTHIATAITDSTTTGRAVLTAASTTAARTAIGAGTSDLVIGITSTTAKAGNYQPTAANISDSTTVGRAVLTAADGPAARTAIGAGSSNLNLGTTSTTAAPGDHTHLATGITDFNEAVMDHLGTTALIAGTNIGIIYNDTTGTLTINGPDTGLTSVGLADLPSGSTHTVYKNPTTGWPVRPTSRVDIHVIWKGPDPSPSIVTSGTAGMHDNTNGYGDSRFVTP